MQLFLLLALVFFGISVATGSDIFSGIIVAATIAGLYFWFAMDVLQYLPHSIGGWIVLVVCYFITGVAWSTFRFYIYYKKEITALYDRFKVGRSHEEAWSYVKNGAPHVSDMKGDITTWIGLWPVSIITYILGDLLYDISTKIYNYVKQVYEKIAQSIIESMFNNTK